MENNKITTRTDVPKERRMMNIETSVASPTAGFAHSIIVTTLYRLDGSGITMGPYYLVCGQSLSVLIDNKIWGVNIVTVDPARISVWASGALLP